MAQAASAATTSSSRPGRRAERRSRSTCPSLDAPLASQSSARSTSIRRRRWPRTRRGPFRLFRLPRLRPRSTTATPEPSGAGRSASGRTSSSPTRTCSHRRPPPPRPLGRRPAEPPLRRRGRGARLPRRVRLPRGERAPPAALAAWVYGAEPQFVLASATIANPASSRSRCSGRRDVIERDTAPRAARTFALWNPPLLDESSAPREPLGEGTGCWPTSCHASCGRSASRSPARRRSSSTASRREGSPSSRSGSRRTGPATHRPSGGTSSAAWSKASCSESRPQMPWSSASTSACSTAPSPSASRERWRACASMGTRGPANEGLAVLVASEDALDQFFMREPEALMTGKSRPRSSTTRTRASSTDTSALRPSRPLWTPATSRSSGPRPSSGRSPWRRRA